MDAVTPPAAPLDYQALFNACPGLYLILSTDLRIIAVSDAYLAATMTCREIIVGQRLFDVFPDNPDDPKADGTRNLHASLQRVLQNRATDAMPIQKYDIRRPPEQGGGFEVRYWSPVNSPLLDASGRIISLIHCVTDVTEFIRVRDQGLAHEEAAHNLRQQNEQMAIKIFLHSQEIATANHNLQMLNEQLAQANGELESFTYSVSHDLRAPLRAIDGFSRMLQERGGDRLDAEDQRLLGIVRQSSKVMGQLIDDLLHFSRVSRSSLQKGRVNMTALVADVWREFQSPFPGEFHLDALPEVDGDASLLRQVWVNLLANAVKFTGKSLHPQIVVSCSSSDQEYRFEVSDNGAGFDNRFAHKLFTVFQRLHRADDFPGTGVGLAIVSRVITRHGGRLWAEGEPGKGAHFHFSLPITTPAPTSTEEMP